MEKHIDEIQQSLADDELERMRGYKREFIQLVQNIVKNCTVHKQQRFPFDAIAAEENINELMQLCWNKYSEEAGTDELLPNSVEFQNYVASNSRGVE